MMESKYLAHPVIELSKALNSHNESSPTWHWLCAQPLETFFDVVSHRCNAHKIEGVPPCDL